MAREVKLMLTLFGVGFTLIFVPQGFLRPQNADTKFCPRFFCTYFSNRTIGQCYTNSNFLIYDVMVSFGKAIKNFYKNAFKFKGRAVMSEYWWVQLYLFLITCIMVLGVIADAKEVRSDKFEVLYIFYLCITAINIIPGLSLSIRRLHDTGLSGWWILINCVPYAGPLLFYLFAMVGGSADDNKWGPNPNKKQETAEDELKKKSVM